MLIDSHCHLDSKEFDVDREAVIGRALEAGIGTMLAIGTGEGPPDLEAGLRLADRYPCILATVGVHPHDAAKAESDVYRRLSDLLRHPKVVALGEIGLDYHYDFSPRDVQQAAFKEQIRMAGERRKPIVIHTREAWDDTFGLLQQHWAPYNLPGILHCFSGGPREVQRALDVGLYLSFGGIVTYPKAPDVHEAARTVPLGRMLVETDAPYLAPVPKRGRRNEPALIVHTVSKLAELRGVVPEEITRITSANFQDILNMS